MKIFTTTGETVLIDKEDYPRIAGRSLYRVRKRSNTYAIMCHWDLAKKRQARKLLHREILDAPDGVMICHLNGNGLDCRKSNLAIGNHRLNGQSFRTKRKGAASRYRGVSVNNGRGKRWTTMFWDNGKTIYLGRFSSQKSAALAYDKEARRRFGKFAHLNFRTIGKWRNE